MALQKTLTTNFSDNVSASYWKLGPIKVDYYQNQSQIVLLGFVDKAARDAHMDEIERRNFDGMELDLDLTQEVTRAIIYDQIKSKISDFSDAADV